VTDALFTLDASCRRLFARANDGPFRHEYRCTRPVGHQEPCKPAWREAT
jgi:hypothetical protein